MRKLRSQWWIVKAYSYTLNDYIVTGVSYYICSECIKIKVSSFPAENEL